MQNWLKITSAKYCIGQDNKTVVCIKSTINGVECFVPLDEDNTDYAEIMRQVAAGTLTIADAD